MKTRYVCLLVWVCACVMFTDMTAQCYTDRHSTDRKDSWISNSIAPSPNPLRPDAHFIMYDLGYLYQLGNLHIWNSNVPDSTDRGVKDISIDISIDGNVWVPFGEYEIKEASGSTFYEGEDVVDFLGLPVRYVLITAYTNYGSPDLFSISEVRFDLQAIVVPVQLLSYEVTCEEDGKVSIEWKTTQEVNNDYFEIEASEDGWTWNAIRKIPSAEASASVHHYSQEIENGRNGKHFFRLVQVDLNGKRTVYDAKQINCQKDISIALYPIPAKDNLSVMIESEIDQLYPVQLFNALGQQIQSFSLQSNVEHTIDLTPYSAGQYLFVFGNDEIIEKKFIIVD